MTQSTIDCPLELGDCWVECKISQESFRSIKGFITFVIIFLSFAAFVPLYFAIRSADSYFVFLYGGASIFLTLFICYLLRHLRFIKNMSLRAFEKGFVYECGRKGVILWDDVISLKKTIIKSFHHGSVSDICHYYTISWNGGKPLNFSLSQYSFQGVLQLDNILQQEVSRRLLPKAWNSYNNGEQVQFGKLSISQAGISKPKETLPWHQVESIKIDKGKVMIRQQGKRSHWYKVGVSKFPNVLVFYTLVSNIQQQQATGYTLNN